MKIKAIFYDFDGVIKDSTAVKSKAFYDLYRPFGKEISEKALQHHIEHGGISRYEKFKLYHKKFLGIDLSPGDLEKWAVQFSDLVKEKVVHSEYVNGAVECISWAKEIGLIQGVISGTPNSEMIDIVNRLEITSNLDFIHGSPKKKTSWIEELLVQFNLNREEVIFIGDATTDYDAAIKTNVHFFLREHDENRELFEGKVLMKSEDLLSLPNHIKSIS
jgi:phosphoglycolate phosphatase-like HAD superfamily hydrolase